jgi:hypothetical protein
MTIIFFPFVLRLLMWYFAKLDGGGGWLCHFICFGYQEKDGRRFVLIAICKQASFYALREGTICRERDGLE